MPFASAEIKLHHHLKILPSHSGTGTWQGCVPCEMAMSVPLLRVEMPVSVCAGCCGTVPFHGRTVQAETEVDEAKEERLPRNVSVLLLLVCSGVNLKSSLDCSVLVKRCNSLKLRPILQMYWLLCQ